MSVEDELNVNGLSSAPEEVGGVSGPPFTIKMG